MLFSSRAAVIVLSATVALLGVACNNENNKATNANSSNQDTANIIATPAPLTTAPAVPNTAVQPQPVTNTPSQLTAYELALDRAAGAYSISQSAQSAEDWKLVINQWLGAIALLKQVPKNSQEFAIAQKKITEYQRQISYAQRQAARPRPQEAERVIAVVPQANAAPKAASLQQPVVEKLTPTTQNPSLQNPSLSQPAQTQQKPVFQTNIKRRMGGTPVIDVTFNGNQQFEMVVDTGASGTVITEKMAAALNVVPIGIAKANTASAKGVQFPVGYINSVEIGGARVQNLPVAIAGTELEIGLLGHDFFGNYDVTIRQNVVEFHPR